MNNPEDAAAALQGMNKASVKGKIIYCKYALDKSKKLAFHKPPPDKKLRERFFTQRASRKLLVQQNIQKGISSGAQLQNIVGEALKQVLSNPHVRNAITSPTNVLPPPPPTVHSPLPSSPQSLFPPQPQPNFLQKPNGIQAIQRLQLGKCTVLDVLPTAVPQANLPAGAPIPVFSPPTLGELHPLQQTAANAAAATAVPSLASPTYPNFLPYGQGEHSKSYNPYTDSKSRFN